MSGFFPEEILLDSNGTLNVPDWVGSGDVSYRSGPVTARYGITSIPTMHVFQGGEIVKTLVGAMPKPKLLRELEPFLG